jgi:hypothetical protein
MRGKNGWFVRRVHSRIRQLMYISVGMTKYIKVRMRDSQRIEFLLGVCTMLRMCGSCLVMTPSLLYVIQFTLLYFGIQTTFLNPNCTTKIQPASKLTINTINLLIHLLLRNWRKQLPLQHRTLQIPQNQPLHLLLRLHRPRSNMR